MVEVSSECFHHPLLTHPSLAGLVQNSLSTALYPCLPSIHPSFSSQSDFLECTSDCLILLLQIRNPHCATRPPLTPQPHLLPFPLCLLPWPYQPAVTSSSPRAPPAFRLRPKGCCVREHRGPAAHHTARGAGLGFTLL